MIPLLPEMSIDPALLRAPAAALNAAGDPPRERDPFAAMLAAALPAPAPEAMPVPAAALASTPVPLPVLARSDADPLAAAPAAASTLPSSRGHLFPDRPRSPRLASPEPVPDGLEGLAPKLKFAPDPGSNAVPVPQLIARPVPVTLSPPLPALVQRPGSQPVPMTAQAEPVLPETMPVAPSAGMRQSLAGMPVAAAPMPVLAPVLAPATGISGTASAPAAILPVPPVPASARGITPSEPTLAADPPPGTALPPAASELAISPAASTASGQPRVDDPAVPVATNEDPVDDAAAGLLVTIAQAVPVPLPAPVGAPVVVAVSKPASLPTVATARVNSGTLPLPRAATPPAMANSGEVAPVAVPVLAGDPLLAAEPGSPPVPAADASASTAPAAPTPAAGITQPFSVAAATPAEPRGETRVQPQQDAAINHIAELQGAARASRPEMLLRHAEFGTVSIKVEGTGPQDWRAVLASRDPGFVPAVQAALTERMVAGATATDLSGDTPGQNPSQDNRYGSSPGSGQGSSQPYMQHQQGRDEGAFGHQRGQGERSTRSSADGGDEALSDPAAPQARGLFA